MALKTESLMFPVAESFESNFGISSFFTILEKKLFKVTAISNSNASVFSVKFFFSLDTDFSEQRFYGFPKFLIIYNIFFIQILVILFFNLFQKRHTFVPLFYKKLAVFFFFFCKKFLSLDLFFNSLTNFSLIGANLFNVSIFILQNLLNIVVVDILFFRIRGNTGKKKLHIWTPFSQRQCHQMKIL